jgi:peptide/nickel transport system substrate-binding protein
MREAGAESGFQATLMASNTPSQQLPAEVVRDNLKDINIDVTLDIIPFSETVGRQSRGDYHFRIQGTSYRLPDPDGFSLMFPSNHGYWAAGAGWQDAELDDLIRRGRAEMDLEKRKQIACETQEALLKKLPWVFMAYGKGSSMAVRTDLVDGYHTDDWQGLVSLYAVQWHLRRLSLKA